MYGIQGHLVTRRTPPLRREFRFRDLGQIKTSTTVPSNLARTWNFSLIHFYTPPKLTKPTAWVQHCANRACLRSASQEKNAARHTGGH
jgi:hypothetical protein